jgi:hypothetical protein
MEDRNPNAVAPAPALPEGLTATGPAARSAPASAKDQRENAWRADVETRLAALEAKTGVQREGVLPPLKLLGVILPDAIAGQPYDFQLQCNDPDAEFIVNYGMPAGLNLSGKGKIFGRSAAPGRANISIRAASGGRVAHNTFPLVTQQAPITAPGPRR